MPRVVHFEIHAADADRAQRFYTRAFGWGAATWQDGKGPPYRLVTTGPESEHGINGAIMQRVDDASVWIVVEVDSVDDAIAAIEREGGSLVHPKRAVPGVGWSAYCRDTEGNVFGVFQPDERAS